MKNTFLKVTTADKQEHAKCILKRIITVLILSIWTDQQIV